MTASKNVAVMTTCVAALLLATACSHGSSKTSSPGTSTPGPSSTTASQASNSAGSSGVAEASATTQSSSSATAGTLKSVAVPTAGAGAQTKAAVPLRSAAAFGDGVSAKVVSTVNGKVTSQGVGMLTGQPKTTFVIQLDNGTLAAIVLNSVTVVATYGSAAKPATQVDLSSAQQFHGSVAARRTAEGSYSFQIPASARGSVTLQLSYASGKPTLQFTGSV